MFTTTSLNKIKNMNSNEFKDLIVFFTEQGYKIFAPVKINDNVVIEEIKNLSSFELAKERPLYPFKKFLYPEKETLLSFSNNEISEDKKDFPRQVLLGVSVYDLKAITLFCQVFEKDPYFQKRLANTLIVGQSPIPEERHQYEIFEERLLEHLKFDIFFENTKNDFNVYTGSEDGQRLLEDFGYKHYEHIEYAGAIPEEGMDPYHKSLIEKFRRSRTMKIWQELGTRCLGCDKCTIVCPTCFCFRIYDSIGANGKTDRCREWDSCFNSEFSEISGGAKFLKNTQERIFNWYEHKFVRIPQEYSLPGCVGCGRCTDVCPAKIDIKETIDRVLNDKEEVLDE